MLALQRILSFWLCKIYLSAALFTVKLPSFHPENCEDFVLMMHFTLQLCDILLPDYRKVVCYVPQHLKHLVQTTLFFIIIFIMFHKVLTSCRDDTRQFLESYYNLSWNIFLKIYCIKICTLSFRSRGVISNFINISFSHDFCPKCPFVIFI